MADGADVVVSGRTQRAADTAAAELGSRDGGGGAVGIGIDNADPAAAQVLVRAAVDHFGALHGALISVGGPPAGPLSRITDEQWREAFDRVFLGALRISRAVAATIAGAVPDPGSGTTVVDLPGDAGAILFVLSTTARQPNHALAVSNGLRPGLAMVAKSMADEFGPGGIRVNGLLPGSIETERIHELLATADDPAEARRVAQSSIPLGRYGTPAEFGAVAAFLLSPAAGFVTGTMLAVDGGISRS